MKKKLVLLLVALISLASFAVESSKKTKERSRSLTWFEAIAQQKLLLLDKHKKSKQSVEVIVKRDTKSHTEIAADVRGLDQIVLVATDAEGYTPNDGVIWSDALLTTTKGETVFLSSIPHSIRLIGPGSIAYGSEKCPQGLVRVGQADTMITMGVRPYSQIVVKLDKKYKAFKAQVSFPTKSNDRNVIFAVKPYTVEKELAEIEKNYPEQLFRLRPLTDLSALLQRPNSSLERLTALAAIRSVKEGAFLMDQLKVIDNNSSLSEQVKGYLDLFSRAAEIRTLETQLEWLNLPAVEAYISDMQKDKSFSPKFDLAAAQSKLKQLKELVASGFNGIYSYDKASIEAAKKALALKREIILSNPVYDVDKLIVGRYKLGDIARRANAPYLGTQPNNWSNQTSARQTGFDASIEELSNLRGEIKSRTIFKPNHGSSVPDLKLHWDGKRILFSMVEEGDHHWQVYEVGVDGQNLRRVTNGTPEDLDYFDATYLPNGKIIANSNVGGQGVPCVSGSDQVGNLCLIDPTDNTMRRLTFDQDANWHPTMMHNGRVMYVRWEYTDLTHYFSRIVMHMNPDGTEQRSLYGSGSVFPNSTFDIAPLPDHPTRFLGIVSGHHGVARSGRLMLYDPAKSRKEEKGMVQEIPFSKRPIIPLIKDELVDGVWPQFIKPIPLSNNYYLVTAKLAPDALWGIYMVDTFDNLTLLVEYEGEGLIYGLPVKETPVPPVIPEKINLDSKEATVFIQDIYEGEGLPGVERGVVKELRVFAYEYAYLKSPSDHTAQGIQSGWDIKRVLGTVPVEEDGSVMFKIPANTPISLQPLDSKGRAIQWMRSWLTGQPGETVSCVGCHEDQNQIPMPKRVMASVKPPKTLTPPEGGVRSFTFDEIQPILDRSCIACHGEKSGLNMIGGRKDSLTGFSKSYLAIHKFFHRQGPEAGMKVLYPYEYHASNSQMVRLLETGHYGVKLTEDEWKTLYSWIDLNMPDKGTFVALEYHGGEQISRRINLNKKYANNIYVDWKQELKEYADYMKTKPAIVPQKPEYTAPQFKEVTVAGFPFDAKAYFDKLKQQPQKKTVEVAPNVFIDFVKIPAGEFVMGKNQKNADYAPAFKAKVEKSFWMSEKEITNQQMQALIPTHDSRFIDQMWKDHVNEGYPANNPEQPALRVRWFDAQEFCKKLSAKSGLNILLPTETQWEWACRAGSDEDFWYGSLNADFGTKENLADKQTLKFAVIGVDPQPMSVDNRWYPYYTFLPKVEGVDDGNMIVSTPGTYSANPFGLYDMHGNVAEWTRSEYRSYPLNSKSETTDERKVVRGGSWRDHPKYSTSSYRKAYLPVQKPFNVGFRVVIEE